MSHTVASRETVLTVSTRIGSECRFPSLGSPLIPLLNLRKEWWRWSKPVDLSQALLPLNPDLRIESGQLVCFRGENEFSLKIGGTTYDVSTHFSTKGKQSVLEQFKRLILSEKLIWAFTHWKKTAEYCRMILPLQCPVVEKEKFQNDNSKQNQWANRRKNYGALLPLIRGRCKSRCRRVKLHNESKADFTGLL